MRLVATRRFKEGARLGRNIPSGGGDAPLLRAGVELTERHREALIRAGVNGVYIEDQLGADIEIIQPVGDSTRAEARGALSRALKEMPGRAAKGEAISDKRMSELMDVAALISDEVARVGEAAIALSDLSAADNYTMEHSIDVTVAGLLVARDHWEKKGRIDWRGERTWDRFDQHLTQLGIGLFLHDIGKLAVPATILHKPGKLEPDEWEIMKQHPTVGLEMVKSDAIWARAKDVIRSHHERWDGSGYPRGLVAEDIQPFARIAAVADVFDAVTSDRPYAEASPQHVGVRIILEGAGVAFDPEIVAAFREVIAPYPPGTDLTLADGRVGVVVSVPPDFIELPLVRVHRDAEGREVKPYDIYLTEHPELAPKLLLPKAPSAALTESDAEAAAEAEAAAA
jgi:HD-GYP domain-containing protein (c-di-GMP phosphodiesterase class II)